MQHLDGVGYGWRSREKGICWSWTAGKEGSGEFQCSCHLLCSALSTLLPFKDTISGSGSTSLSQLRETNTVYKTPSPQVVVIVCQCVQCLIHTELKLLHQDRDYHKPKLTLRSQEDSSRHKSKQTKIKQSNIQSAHTCTWNKVIVVNQIYCKTRGQHYIL